MCPCVQEWKKTALFLSPQSEQIRWKQLPTDVNAIMRVEKPDTCAKSVFEINMLCGLVQYRGKYRGEHYIHFRQRISDRLAARIVAGIKDSKAHAYFF